MSDFKDELKLYHDTIADQLQIETQAHSRPLTAGDLLHMMQQAWDSVEYDRGQRADKWAKSKGLI